MYLFQKNIFSSLTPLFSASTDEETNRLRALLKRHYALNDIKEIQQVGAFEINSNNWKISTDHQTYILKRAPVSKQHFLTVQAEWTQELHNSNFPTLLFVRNTEQALITVTEEHIFCLTHFEEGHYFGSHLEEWGELIRCLKRLYDHSLSNVPPRNFPTRTFFNPEEDKRIEQLKKTPHIPEIAQADIVQIVTDYERSRLIFRENEHRFQTAVFHVDVHPHNILFRDHQLRLLTDFESFQLTTMEISLGFGLYKCSRQLLSATDNDASQLKKIMEKFAAQHDQSFPDHTFLTSISFGKMDVLKRLLYILNELMEKGSSKWMFMFQLQLTSLNEITEMEKLLS